MEYLKNPIWKHGSYTKIIIDSSIIVEENGEKKLTLNINKFIYDLKKIKKGFSPYGLGVDLNNLYPMEKGERKMEIVREVEEGVKRCGI